MKLQDFRMDFQQTNQEECQQQEHNDFIKRQMEKCLECRKEEVNLMECQEQSNKIKCQQDKCQIQHSQMEECLNEKEKDIPNQTEFKSEQKFSKSFNEIFGVPKELNGYIYKDQLIVLDTIDGLQTLHVYHSKTSKDQFKRVFLDAKSRRIYYFCRMTKSYQFLKQLL